MRIMRMGLLGAATWLAALPAGAAPGPSLPVVGSPTAITAGVFVPSGSDAKDKGGSSQFEGSFRYRLPLSGLISSTSTVLSLGVQTGSQGGTHSTVIPVTITELFGASGKSTEASGNAFYGAGVGVYFLNQTNISVATRIGAQIEAGYNFNSLLFADAKYQFVTHADGLNLDLGFRF